MGSYSQLTIAEYPILSHKNGYFNEVTNLIFQPEDYISEKRKENIRNTIIWADTFQNSKRNYTFKGFVQTVKVCKSRLEILGTTLKTAEKDFLSSKMLAVTESELLYQFPLSEVTFNQYLKEITDIIKQKEIHYDQLATNLRESLISGELGIYGQTTNNYLYSILTQLPDDAVVEYDLTDVIYGGWVREKEVTEINIEKIIVLTEGKTDTEFISSSLKILYPYLYPYFHFINFDDYKVESNASALSKFVISLAASNIKHPIIAIFDNDTTGIMEMNRLKCVSIPSNFKILKLPDLKLAKKYPTVGPTGIKKMNINGFACGIEMYLGEDILTKKDGQLIPVHWKAYNEKEKQYQGEISEKNNVQQAFRDKLKLNKDHADFSDIDLVLKSIFTVYQ